MEGRTGTSYALRLVAAMEGVDNVEIRRSLWVEATAAHREAQTVGGSRGLHPRDAQVSPPIRDTFNLQEPLKELEG